MDKRLKVSGVEGDGMSAKAPSEGFRTTKFGIDQLRWKCLRCGHTSDHRLTGHEYKCGRMVLVDPYTETPIKFEDMNVFERMDWEFTQEQNP